MSGTDAFNIVTQAITDIVSRIAPAAPKPDTQARPEETLLQQLAPVLAGDDALTGFVQTLLLTPHAEIARAQADALMPVWQALDQSNPKQNGLRAASLHRMFREITRYQNILQLQRPVIFANNIDTLHTLTEKAGDLFGHMGMDPRFRIFGGAEGFGRVRLFNNHKSQTPYYYQFTFMTVKTETAGREQIISMPVLRLSPDMLRLARQNGTHDMLSALQDCCEVSNHDYIHATTACIISPYSSDKDHSRINIEKTAYMQVMRHHKNVRSEDDMPMRRLYPYNHTSWQAKTPLKLQAYDVKQAGPLEGHALHAHKHLYTQHISPDADITRINVFFDGLQKLIKTVSKQDAHMATQLGMYYTMVLYHRMLHMLPYTHPLMQALETRAALLPIKPAAWNNVISQRLLPQMHESAARISNKTGLRIQLRTACLPKGMSGDIDALPVQILIRLAAHMHGMAYWQKLHYTPHRDIARHAIPDMHRVFKTTADEMALVRAHERRTKCERAHKRQKQQNTRRDLLVV